jgi:hypothetical protein
MDNKTNKPAKGNNGFKLENGHVEMLFREADMPSPEEVIISGGGIKWGKKNVYPQELVGMFYDNPVHGGIINQKIKFITAGGIEATSQEVMENAGGAYSLEEVMEVCAKDNEIFNGFAVLFKRKFATNVDGNGEATKETLGWYVEPVDFEQIRVTEDGNYYEYSENWASSQQSAEKQSYRMIPDIQSMSTEHDEGLLYVIDKPKQRTIEIAAGKTKLTKSCYPIPSYSGAISSILAGIEMDFFTYSEVVNGYKGGTLINFANGSSGDEKKDEAHAKKIKNEATARNRQGGLIINYSNGQDRAATVQQINGNDLNKRYIESNKEILKKIMVAHGVISPALFGVLSENMFGSKEEMETAYMLFNDKYVKGRQRFITSALNWAYRLLVKVDPQIKYKEYLPPFLVQAQQENETQLRAEKMAKQKDEKNILDLFAGCGTSKSEFAALRSQEFGIQSDDEFVDSYMEFMKFVSAETKIILTMINNGEDFQATYKAIGKDGAYLATKILELERDGLIRLPKTGWEVTTAGSAFIATKADLQVLYSYEKKPDAPDLVAGGKSRDFCAKLIELDRFYTREEIELIGVAVDRDVWSYRGGWYHNPDSNVNTPSCRHYWSQKIVSKLN